MSIQAAATILALGVAFVLFAVIPIGMVWVFVTTLRHGAQIEEEEEPRL